MQSQRRSWSAAWPLRPTGTGRSTTAACSIDSTNFALVIGGSTGGGQLKFQDKAYDFKIAGLSAGVNVGVTKVEAAGFVYDLKDIAKFPGTYKAFSAGAAAVGGAGEIYLKNENGVIMKLASTVEGPAAQRGRGVGRQGHDEVTGLRERRPSR